jgi:hypothetical protein
MCGVNVTLVNECNPLSPKGIIEKKGPSITVIPTFFKLSDTLQSIISQFEEIPRYWTSGNTAEVDFLLQLDNQIIPVEVKSDRHVKSRSLTLYRSEYNPPLAIRYSLQNIEYNNGLINIPLFLADYTKNIIQTL